MIVNVGSVSFNVCADKNEDFKFWKSVNCGRWESHTFKIFKQFSDIDHSIIDIGGYIGPTVLYGAHFARHVYTIEPDVVALHSLKKNVSLNSNLSSKVSICKCGISDKSGFTKLRAYGKFKLGGSGSTIMLNSKKTNQEILIKLITFQNFIDLYNIIDCNFIKMDVEGAEFLILPTMLNYLSIFKPTLYISFHNVAKPKKAIIAIEELFSKYPNICNAKTGKTIKLHEIFITKEVLAHF